MISSVEPRECLWNAGIEDYKKKHLRDAAWREIAEVIFDGKYSAAEVCAKWSNLRIQFKSNGRKHGKSGQGTDEMNTVSWKFYDHLKFIEAAENQQSTASASNLVSETNLLYKHKK